MSFLILPPQKRGPERKLACYPTRRLGLRLINHTSFRGTEFCVADQFSISIYCVFFHTHKRFLNIFKKPADTQLIYFIHFFFDRLVSGKIYGRSTSSIERKL